jgi:hypothetical protein
MLSESVTLTVIDFSVEYQADRWCGTGAAAVEAFLSLSFLPWPMRASVKINRAGLRLGEQEYVPGSSEFAWIPPVLVFRLIPSEGMTLEGQFFVEPEELEIVRNEVIGSYRKLADRCLAQTNEFMKRFNEQHPAAG